MSADYQAIGWNRFKARYDTWMAFGIFLYMTSFVGVSAILHPTPQDISPMILLIRAFGTCAFLLLHIILLIGPLTRFFPALKPLLYNRRHLGVSMFLVATGHVVVVMIWYHGYGVILPLLSLFISNPNYTDLARFPFELFGVLAYLILLLMALTSHDFWLKFFGAPVWKLLHICVYLAYFLLVCHVLFGYVQTESYGVMFFAVVGGAGLVVGAHLLAGAKEIRADRRIKTNGDWTTLCRARDLKNEHGRGFMLKRGDKIAVFRYNDNRVCAVANACAHQNGPLCEGRVINGRIVCPWHGYEYVPESGRSPAPFTEKIPVYRVRIRKGMVEVQEKPLPAGAKVPPAVIR